MLELEKLQKRVDEFNDYGELDMMQQYVNDVRTVQRKITELKDQVCGRSCVTFVSVLT